MTDPIRLLAFSGSLRAGGSNTILLEAARLVAAPSIVVDLYGGIAALPAFNPDLDQPDGSLVPAIVLDLRRRVGEANGLLISSPEYAHGIPGSFKNMLDWLVGSLEFPGKPIGLISASSRSVHVKAQLTEVLTTMSADLVPGVTIEMAGRGLDATGAAADPEIAAALRSIIDAIAHGRR